MKNTHDIYSTCEFSIVIPVVHEALIINTLIEHLYNQHYAQDLEIIVVDGDPQGGTINALPRTDVRVIVSEPGRGRQMNAGAVIARGEFLVFLHADTHLPPNALSLIRRALTHRWYVAGVFDLGIRSQKFIFKIISSTASLRTRITKLPYGDQVFFMRRNYFNEIGGYREIPLMEDVELMQRIKRRGDRICILSDRVLTSPRRWEREGIIYCTLRNWILVMLYLMGVSPHRLAHFFRST